MLALQCIHGALPCETVPGVAGVVINKDVGDVNT